MIYKKFRVVFLKVIHFLLIGTLLFPLTLPSSSQAKEPLPQIQLTIISTPEQITFQWDKSILPSDTTYRLFRIDEEEEIQFPITGYSIPYSPYTFTPSPLHYRKSAFLLKAYDLKGKIIAFSDPTPASSLYESSANPPCLIMLRYQQNNKNYYRNDILQDAMETEPINQWSRLFLVVRYVAKNVPDTIIDWTPPNKNKTVKDGKNGIVVINTQYTKPPRKLEFFIDYNQYKLNGQWYPVDKDNTQARPFIKNGRTLLPLRKVGESLDGEIQWNSSTLTAILSFKDPDCEEIKEISQTFTFKQPTWQKVPDYTRPTKPPRKLLSNFADVDEYRQIFVEGCYNFAQPGYPLLPSRGVEMEIPEGYELLSLTTKPLKTVVLPEYYPIIHGQAPTNETVKNWKEAPPNASVYKANVDYPVDLIANTIQGERNNKKNLIFGLTPVRINAVTKKVNFYSEIQVTMKLKKVVRPDKGKPKPKGMSPTKPIQPNPTTMSLPTGSYKMVIIAPNALIGTPTGVHSNWADYAVWKSSTPYNIPTKTYSIEDIYLNYTGANQQEQIKAFIQDAKTNWGIEYVLLGGDTDTIPSYTISFTDLFGNALAMPSDTYYACLDSTLPWNPDITSFANMDLQADVYVGRVSVQTLTDLTNFFNKQLVVEPEFSNHTFFNNSKLLFSGGKLIQNYPVFGEQSLENLIVDPGITANPNFVSMTKHKLYQQPALFDPLASLLPSDNINTPIGFANELNSIKPRVLIPAFRGMSDIYKFFDIGSATVSHNPLGISNWPTLSSSNNPFLVNSIDDASNRFDEQLSISEKMIRDPNAAFAYIGNSSSVNFWYYLGQPVTTPTCYYQLEFFKNFFQMGTTPGMSLGKAFHYGKEGLILFYTDQCYRFTYHAQNLLGDPSTGAAEEEPVDSCCEDFEIMPNPITPVTVAPGISHNTFQIKNNCTQPMTYAFSFGATSGIHSINDPFVTIDPGMTSSNIDIEFEIPAGTTPGTIISYPFIIQPISLTQDLCCPPVEKSFEATCATETPNECCEFTLNPMTTTPITVVPGNSGTYQFTISNQADCTQQMTYNFGYTLPSNITNITPSFVIVPAGTTPSDVVTITFGIPLTSTPGSTVTIPFIVQPHSFTGDPICCAVPESFDVICGEESSELDECCDYTLTPITQAPITVTPGQPSTYVFTITNNLPNCSQTMTYNFGYLATSGINSITPTFVIVPHGTTSAPVTVNFTVPAPCATGTTVPIPFIVQPHSFTGDPTCCAVEEHFDVICGEEPSNECCEFTLNPVTTTPIHVTPGVASAYQFTITNNSNTCNQTMTYNFGYAASSGITSITPTFVIVPSGITSVPIIVNFTVPAPCATGTTVPIAFIVQPISFSNPPDPCCLPVEKYFTVICEPSGPCCDYSILFSGATTACPGETKIKKFKITNTCPLGTQNLKYNFSVNSGNILSITPNFIILAPGDTSYPPIEISYKMPCTSTSGSETFIISIQPEGTTSTINCQPTTQPFTISLVQCPQCQISVIDTDLTNHPHVTGLIAGSSVTYAYEVSNTSNIPSPCTNSINFSILSSTNNISSITPTQFTLQNGHSQIVLVTYTIPNNCVSDSLVPFTFSVLTNCGESRTITENLTCLGCCAYTISPDPEHPNPSQLSPGQVGNFNFIITNNSNTECKYVIESADPNIIPTPYSQTLTISPSASGIFGLKYRMPNGSPPNHVDVTFHIVAHVVGQSAICIEGDYTFQIQFKTTSPPCCDFEYIYVTQDIPEVCPGQEGIFKFKLKNTCTVPRDYSFSKPNGSIITSINPSSISNLGAGQTSQDITITFKMNSDCQQGIVSSLEFIIQPMDARPPTCEPITKRFKVKCKECPPACCDFKITLNSKEILELIPGGTYTYEYQLMNNCPPGSKDVSFTLTPDSNGYVTSITPNKLTLSQGKGAIIKATFTMPRDCTGGASVKFGFIVTPDCGTYQDVTFKIKCASSPVCCTYTLISNTKPPSEAKPGTTFTVEYELTNTCPTGSKDITFTFTGSTNITSITPSKQTLSPGKHVTVKVTGTIPRDCKGGSSVPFSFVLTTDCGKEEKFSFTVQCAVASVCCTYTLISNTKPPSEAKPGTSFTVEYNLTNTCPSGSKDIAFTFTGSNNASITPSNITLSPGKSAVIKLTGTMPKDCKGGESTTFSLVVATNCGKEQRFDVTVKCAAAAACCDWLFRTLPEAKIGKAYICPGETATIGYYEVFNNCPKGSNAINFSITWPSDGKIVSISPTSFTLQPQTRQILSIQIKMISPCKPEEVINFPFTINTKECGKKDVNVVAYCKDCWCKAQSMIIRVTKIDLREGWVEGTVSGSRTPVRFYFNPTERKWGNIKIDQCIEVCFEDRKDANGNPIKFALDYRVVSCPQSAPKKDESKYVSATIDCIYFEKEKINEI
jgi:hypothetical protein